LVEFFSILRFFAPLCNVESATTGTMKCRSVTRRNQRPYRVTARY